MKLCLEEANKAILAREKAKAPGFRQKGVKREQQAYVGKNTAQRTIRRRRHNKLDVLLAEKGINLSPSFS